MTLKVTDNYCSRLF